MRRSGRENRPPRRWLAIAIASVWLALVIGTEAHAHDAASAGQCVTCHWVRSHAAALPTAIANLSVADGYTPVITSRPSAPRAIAAPRARSRAPPC